MVFATAVGPDDPPMKLHKIPCQRQPESGSLVSAAFVVIQLFEGIENPLQVFSLNADAAIAYGDKKQLIKMEYRIYMNDNGSFSRSFNLTCACKTKTEGEYVNY